MSKIRILLLDTGREWGGGTNSMFELLKRIDRERFDITALFYHNYAKGADSDLRTELAAIGIPLLILPPRRQPLWAKLGKELVRGLLAWNHPLRRRAVFELDRIWRIGPQATRLAEILRDGGYDLLYSNNQPSSNLEAYLAAEISDVPLVQHCRIEAHLNAFELAAVKRSGATILCVSQGVADSLIAQGVDPRQCKVVCNGIDTSQPLPDAAEARDALSLGTTELVIGTVGSLIARKGIDHLLRACARLAPRLARPLRVLIVGDGPQRDALQRLAQELGMAEQVRFTGFQNQPLRFIAAMDIFVLASAKEGLPRVILEAMLSRKPVIASSVVGSRELVRDGDTGLLFPHGDVDALVNRLEVLARDDALRQRMGNRGREVVCAEYDIRRYVVGVENVLATAVPAPQPS